MPSADKKLPSERVVVSAPMSFSGSAQRLWRLTSLSQNVALKGVLAVPAVCLIAIAWCLIAVWYCLCLLFFVPFIIFRLFRRSARKDKAAQLRHREMMARLEQSQASDSGQVVQAEKTPQT